MVQPAQPGVPRRRVLVGSLAAGTAALTARSYARVIGANDRIRVGFIGVGGMGSSHIEECLKIREADNLDLVAACDCWTSRAETAAARIGGRSFTDYRKVLDDDDVDYVTIATPEHCSVGWTTATRGSMPPTRFFGLGRAFSATPIPTPIGYGWRNGPVSGTH